MDPGKKGQLRQQYILESIQESSGGKPKNGIFCELTEAYVVVNHDILVAKLNPHGGTVTSWFVSYLHITRGF
jgi:hypothetical protein